MIETADVVIIGSGGLGAATAHHLGRRGGLDILLLDRRAIGSQTSPRAAGMISCARRSEVMVTLMKEARRQIEAFTAETGQPIGYVQAGSLKIARRPGDAEVLQDDLSLGRRMGLDIEALSPEAACRLHPLLRPDGIVGALRIGDDGYFDPAQMTAGLSASAAERGVRLMPDTAVLSVDIAGGSVAGVTTDRGTIRAPVVVDAAGAWTRPIAEATGITVPTMPTRHQLVVTEPIEGVTDRLPMIRIMDAAVYARPCRGGLLWGAYEEAPRFFDAEVADEDFDISAMPLDMSVLDAAAADVAAQLPVLRTAGISELRGGLPTMTADGLHVVGPSEIEGFYFASGCNVAGLSAAPALGEQLARWIVDGRPTLDLSSMAVDRFRDLPRSDETLRRRVAWQYRHFYGAV